MNSKNQDTTLLVKISRKSRRAIICRVLIIIGWIGYLTNVYLNHDAKYFDYMIFFTLIVLVDNIHIKQEIRIARIIEELQNKLDGQQGR